jgi:hypothetical protein
MIYLLSQTEVADQAHRFLIEDKYTITGVLLLIVFVIAMGIWKLGSWTAKEVVIPLRDRGMKVMESHLDKVDGTLSTMGNTMTEIAKSLSQMSATQVVNTQRLDTIEKKVDNLDDKVENLDTHMKLQDSKIDSISRGHKHE